MHLIQTNYHNLNYIFGLLVFRSLGLEWGLVLLYLFVTFNYFNHHLSPFSFYFHLVAPANLVNT